MTAASSTDQETARGAGLDPAPRNQPKETHVNSTPAGTTEHNAELDAIHESCAERAA